MADRPPFRPDLEGLRGVSILLVVLFHAGVSGLAGGFVGVDVFFVLSGFFITGLLVRERSDSGDVDLTEFYGRRALRLLPPRGGRGREAVASVPCRHLFRPARAGVHRR